VTSNPLTAPSGPPRPLVIRFGAFGDMVLMIPVLKFLAQRYGAACDVVSSGGWTAPLIERVPAVHRGWLLTSRRAPYWLNRSQQQLVRLLRDRPPAPVYVFEPDEKPLQWLARAGIGPEWICTQRELPALPQEHILDHAFRLAALTPLAVRTTVAPPPAGTRPNARPDLTPADRQDCADWLARHQLAGPPLVLIQPGNKKTMKGGNRKRRSNVVYWAEAKWAAVITAVQTVLPGGRAVICGTPAERPFAEDIAARLAPEHRGRCFVANDELPLIRLLALQERAHSMVSVDTGPAHAAAAMGCPLVVLFTRHPHRSPQRYAPVPTTAPVRIVEPAGTAPDATLEQLEPAAVLDAWRALPAR
jgi:heptosyltransferase-2/heptosyltransferase-3